MSPLAGMKNSAINHKRARHNASELSLSSSFARQRFTFSTSQNSHLETFVFPINSPIAQFTTQRFYVQRDRSDFADVGELNEETVPLMKLLNTDDVVNPGF